MDHFTEKGLAEINGIVEDVIYANPDNGFSVIALQPSDGGEVIKAAGAMPELLPGEYVTLTGRTEYKEPYGETFRTVTCTKAVPADGESLVRFLSCGLFPGIGEVTAKAIVGRFGAETPSVILKTPERLAEIKKISLKRAYDVGKAFVNYYDFSETIGYFSKLGISTSIAMAIYKKYGSASVKVTERNPYMLIDEVPRVGFRTADAIAASIGFGRDSGSRICAYISYYLQSQLGNGNVCYPEDALVYAVSNELETDPARTGDAVESLISAGSLVRFVPPRAETVDRVQVRPESLVMLRYMDECEQFVSDSLLALSEESPARAGDFDGFIARFEEDNSIELSTKQKDAVRAAVENSFSVITGGPGTGKTTVTKAIYRYISQKGKKCVLAAPTGRAAKRMAEAVGIEAKTIHRLLEYSPYQNEDETDDSAEEYRMRFNRNEDNPLDADVLIIDEVSMLDTLLAYHLLKAVKSGTRAVFLGDKDQLPSVGPGNLLKDIILSGKFTVTTLDFVYRQSDTSLINYNAQRINSGEMPEMNIRDRDFFMLDHSDPSTMPELVADLIGRRLPKAYGADPLKDVQVLIPSKKGPCGVENMNVVLQNALNPGQRGKDELVFGERLFRVNDRIMQIRNNYEIEWEHKYQTGVSGKGIFNGEMGIITDIDRAARTVTVEFDDERIAEYTQETLSQLELCYAITVHKSQGSEFNYCVIALSGIPSRLATRNILYTAVTRAKKMIIIAGERRYLRMMIENDSEETRYTCLRYRLTAEGSGGSVNGFGELI